MNPEFPMLRERNPVVTRSEIGIDFDGAAKAGLRGLILLKAVFVEMPQTALISLLGTLGKRNTGRHHDTLNGDNERR